MIPLSNTTKKKLEIMLEEDTKAMPIRERIKYFDEVTDYILNLCPLGYKYKCDDCEEKCKVEGIYRR